MPVRIYDISKKLGLDNKQVLAKAKELNLTAARVASSSLDKITAEYLEQQLILAHPELAAPPPPPVATPPPPEPARVAPPAAPAARRPSKSPTGSRCCTRAGPAFSCARACRRSPGLTGAANNGKPTHCH